jgi:CrcB protein
VVTLLVALAAGVGAVARYLVDQVVQHRRGGDFPWGTVIVNVTGSFVLGLVVGLQAHQHLAEGPALVVGTGFAGGFTTLSTWAWETLALAELGRGRDALANLVVSFGPALAAAALGLTLARL